MRGHVAAIAFAIGLTLVAGDIRAATDDGSAAAEQFVAALARDIGEVYRERPSPEAARAKFTEIFERAVDIGAMAAAVLGRKWAAATPAEQGRFVELLQERAVASLQAKLASGEGDEACVTEAEALGEAQFFVRGHVCDGVGEQRTLGWLVVGQDEELRVRDFVVDGTSFVATLRAEYASVMTRNGGSVAALIAEMEARTR